MAQLISIKNLFLKRQKKKILDNISFDIADGDFITIVGPNGAGKSMLIKCIVGLQRPDQGKIVKTQAISIGYIPQNFRSAFTIPITVERFLEIGNEKKIKQLKHVIDEVQIDSLLKNSMQFLSGGELQRVLLARSLINMPDLLVMDEPAQNLDLSGQLKFYKLIENIYTERKLTILMVSHDLHMVMSKTQKVICMYHHICCSGEPQAVAKDPEFISLFGKEMANMLAVYQHSHSHIYSSQR